MNRREDTNRSQDGSYDKIFDGHFNETYNGYYHTYKQTNSTSKVNFLEFLGKEVPYDYKLKKLKPRKMAHEPLSYEIDDSHRFRNTVSITKGGSSTIHSLTTSTRNSGIRDFSKKRQLETEIKKQFDKQVGPIPKHISVPVEVVDWENEVFEFDAFNRGNLSNEIKSDLEIRKVNKNYISGDFKNYISADANKNYISADVNKNYLSADANKNYLSADTKNYLRSDAETKSTSPSTDKTLSLSRSFTEDKSVEANEYVNELLNNGWEKNIWFDDKEMPIYKKHLTLYVDDPNLIFEKSEEKKIRSKKKAPKNGIDKLVKNKYNISNDKYYVSEIKNKVSLGTFGVQHSLPALKLDPKFYKTNPSKEELRNFHKMPIFLSKSPVSKNETYTFKTPSKTKSPGSMIKKSHELSLTDESNFMILEYYDEFPFFITNPGMASLVNTFYRKIDSSDDPTTEGCIVLEPEDEAPFFGFGNVKAGTYLKTIDNNLYTAPIVPHKSSDFLCILENGEITMRPIGTIHLAGQELPKEEVFAPHSRKLNQFCKDRLKVAAYRIFSKGKDLLMSQLDQMFPYFSEGSKRKWLKEYCDCEKKGKENVWVLKDSFAIIGEEDLRKLVTPENICQYESMLATERRMQDLGYKCTETDEEEESYDFYSPSWYLSRNFVNAANGRGLLELSPTAEVTSIGEAFSMRKIKLKKGNESENRRIIAEHQATYKERIGGIWNNHIEAISNTEVNYSMAFSSSQKKSTFEQASETTGADLLTCLLIKRTYEEKGLGMPLVKIERVYDGRVIKAYLRTRKTLRLDEKKTSFTCSSCGQVGHMRTNKSCPNFTGASRLLSRQSSKKKESPQEKKASTIFQERLLKLISVFMNIPFSTAFHKPVSQKKIPDYFLVIKNPMDLGTIKNNVKTGKYSKFSEFMGDLLLMRDNCAIYNGPQHSLTEISQNMMDTATGYLNENMEEIEAIEDLITRE